MCLKAIPWTGQWAWACELGENVALRVALLSLWSRIPFLFEIWGSPYLVSHLRDFVLSKGRGETGLMRWRTAHRTYVAEPSSFFFRVVPSPVFVGKAHQLQLMAEASLSLVQGHRFSQAGFWFRFLWLLAVTRAVLWFHKHAVGVLMEPSWLKGRLLPGTDIYYCERQLLAPSTLKGTQWSWLATEWHFGTLGIKECWPSRVLVLMSIAGRLDNHRQ